MMEDCRTKELLTTKSCDSFFTEKRSILRHRSDSMSSFSESPPCAVTATTRGVRFDAVQFREHTILLGDNPGGVSGPPLTLGWQVQSAYEMRLDEYEQDRPERRNKYQMTLPEMVRVDILREWGYSRQEIAQLTRPVNQARERRKACTNGSKLDGILELKEKAFRGLRHLVSMGRKKREERLFLERCARFDKGKLGKDTVKQSIRTACTTEDESHSEEFA